MTTYFSDRAEAGKILAKELAAYKDKRGAIVLALPRGGAPIGFEIAKALHLPLDLMLVRKLGVPGHEELAMGAMAIGNVMAFNEDVVRRLVISRSAIERVIATERVELTRRNSVYRGGRPAPDLRGKTVILVDDGCATGANMRAAVQAVRKQEPGEIVAAVPVASDSAYALLQEAADVVVCPFVTTHFYSLGHYYIDFRQMEDQEVITLLERAERRKDNRSKTTKRVSHEHERA